MQGGPGKEGVSREGQEGGCEQGGPGKEGVSREGLGRRVCAGRAWEGGCVQGGPGKEGVCREGLGRRLELLSRECSPF